MLLWSVLRNIRQFRWSVRMMLKLVDPRATHRQAGGRSSLTTLIYARSKICSWARWCPGSVADWNQAEIQRAWCRSAKTNKDRWDRSRKRGLEGRAEQEQAKDAAATATLAKMLNEQEWLDAKFTDKQWLQVSRKGVEDVNIWRHELIAEQVQLVELCSASDTPVSTHTSKHSHSTDCFTSHYTQCRTWTSINNCVSSWWVQCWSFVPAGGAIELLKRTKSHEMIRVKKRIFKIKETFLDGLWTSEWSSGWWPVTPPLLCFLCFTWTGVCLPSSICFAWFSASLLLTV